MFVTKYPVTESTKDIACFKMLVHFKTSSVFSAGGGGRRGRHKLPGPDDSEGDPRGPTMLHMLCRSR
jgi:hypothetical protein